jgi:hypothetical protein
MNSQNTHAAQAVAHESRNWYILEYILEYNIIYQMTTCAQTNYVIEDMLAVRVAGFLVDACCRSFLNWYILEYILENNIIYQMTTCAQANYVGCERYRCSDLKKS